MKRMIRVAATSTATLEAVSPPYNLGPANPRANLELGMRILAAAGAQEVDLVCLPETFLTAGMDSVEARDHAVTLDGPEVERIAEMARRHRMNVVAGLYVHDDDQIVNLAVLLDRGGDVVGTYRKQFPTEGEISAGVRPGDGQCVFDTDVGRVGLGICFDLNWRSLWQRYEDEGADVVCWISAYDGGFPLRVRAWEHGYPIVSSVMSYHGRVVDVTGEYLASTSRWSRLAVQDVNLDKRVFHTDGQMEKLLVLQEAYGPRVRVRSTTEEHVFTVEPLTDELDIAEIVREHGLVDWRTYIRESEAARDAALSSDG